MNTQENKNLIEVDNKYWKDKRIQLERLHNNPDFQSVILNGYFKDLAINSVSLLAADYTIRENKRSEIMETLIAISRLEDHFHTIMHLGAPSIEDSDEDEEDFNASGSSVL